MPLFSTTANNTESQKPELFQNPYVALRHIPYIFWDASSRRELTAGGVLGKGATVWLESNLEPQNGSRSVVAFVEDLGMICLDPR